MFNIHKQLVVWMLIETLKVISKHFNVSGSHFFCIFRDRHDCYEHSQNLPLTQNGKTKDAVPNRKKMWKFRNALYLDLYNEMWKFRFLSSEFKTAASRALRNVWMHSNEYSQAQRRAVISINAVISGTYSNNNNNSKYMNTVPVEPLYILFPSPQYDHSKCYHYFKLSQEIQHGVIQLLRPIWMHPNKYSQEQRIAVISHIPALIQCVFH